MIQIWSKSIYRLSSPFNIEFLPFKCTKIFRMTFNLYYKFLFYTTVLLFKVTGVSIVILLYPGISVFRLFLVYESPLCYRLISKISSPGILRNQNTVNCFYISSLLLIWPIVKFTRLKLLNCSDKSILKFF